jgi:acyl-coenzyme A thioesterase PaaI-like protein
VTVSNELPDQLPTESGLSEKHFISGLGISLRYQDGTVLGRADLKPSMWATGTRRPRISLLATMVDVVGGHVPDGPLTPTLDLRLQLTSTVPESGEVSLVGRAHRVGRRFVVAETVLSDANHEEFGRATTTFLNQKMPTSPFHDQALVSAPFDSFDDTIGASRIDDATFEVVPRPEISNGPGGQVQGGVQAYLAERAAESIIGPGAEVVDLDIRFLSRVRVGPLRAHAKRVGRTGGLESVRVDLRDAGDADRLVANVSLLVSAG